MVSLELEEFYFLGALDFVGFTPLKMPSFEGLNAFLNFNHFVEISFLLVLKFHDLLLQGLLAMLGLQLLPHRKCHRRVVQHLVSLVSQVDFLTNAE